MSGTVEEVALGQELVVGFVQLCGRCGDLMAIKVSALTLTWFVTRVRAPLLEEKLAFISLKVMPSWKAGPILPSSCSWAAGSGCCAASGIVEVLRS